MGFSSYMNLERVSELWCRKVGVPVCFSRCFSQCEFPDVRYLLTSSWKGFHIFYIFVVTPALCSVTYRQFGWFLSRTFLNLEDFPPVWSFCLRVLASYWRLSHTPSIYLLIPISLVWMVWILCYSAGSGTFLPASHIQSTCRWLPSMHHLVCDREPSITKGVIICEEKHLWGFYPLWTL